MESRKQTYQIHGMSKFNDDFNHICSIVENNYSRLNKDLKATLEIFFGNHKTIVNNSPLGYSTFIVGSQVQNGITNTSAIDSSNLLANTLFPLGLSLMNQYEHLLNQFDDEYYKDIILGYFGVFLSCKLSNKADRIYFKNAMNDFKTLSTLWNYTTASYYNSVRMMSSCLILKVVISLGIGDNLSNLLKASKKDDKLIEEISELESNMLFVFLSMMKNVEVDRISCIELRNSIIMVLNIVSGDLRGYSNLILPVENDSEHVNAPNCITSASFKK